MERWTEHAGYCYGLSSVLIVIAMKGEKMAYEIREPDYELSPFSGMTRKHWIDAGLHLLDGVMGHVKNFDDPIALPKQPGKTYPQPDDPPYKYRAAEFEGLSRTFLIASSIIEDDPEAEAGGHNLRDYYANQILRGTDPKSPSFWGFITDMQKEYNFPLYQHTAEGAALSIGLVNALDSIWNRYSKKEKDQVAAVFSDYFHNKTNSHNWRFFNVTLGSFLKANGYQIDETILLDHLQNLLAFYAGDGWYRDESRFDYYSPWAFQFYGPIWASRYGYRTMPEIARVIEERHHELMKTYPLMFSREGHSLMWGRSIMYRCAASAPLAVHFMLEKHSLDPGWARRIASGNILQFISRDDFYIDGAPTLGFYRTFEPLVQSYSCAASPFWLSKVFLALALSKDSPFWTAKETEGEWPKIGNGLKTVVLNGPGLAITAYGETGTSELRPGKVKAGKSDPNDTRLAYNTDFLWEADDVKAPHAMSYTVNEIGIEPHFPNMNIRFVGERNGVLYRQIEIAGWMSRASLADIVVPGGVLRVDRMSIAYAHHLWLGHYGLPHIGGDALVETRDFNGWKVITAAIPGRRLALMAVNGWNEVNASTRTGLNPETEGESTIIYAHRQTDRDYAGMDVCATLMLHATDDDEWTDDDFSIVSSFELVPLSKSGSPLGAKVELGDGRKIEIDYDAMEGAWMQ